MKFDGVVLKVFPTAPAGKFAQKIEVAQKGDEGEVQTAQEGLLIPDKRKARGRTTEVRVFGRRAL